MGDKKKQLPIPAPKAPPAPAKQQAPPTAAPVPATEAKAEDGGGGAPARDLTQVPVESADKPTHAATGDPANLLAPNPLVTVPITPIDWGPIAREFSLRGVTFLPRDQDGVEQYWFRTYRSLTTFWGLPADTAAKVTNAGIPAAVSFSLARDHPTMGEQFDRDTEKMLGPGKSLGKVMIPLNAPIEWSVGKIIGKPFKLEF
jgi:hypothetical protein